MHGANKTSVSSSRAVAFALLSISIFLSIVLESERGCLGFVEFWFW